MKVFTYRKVFWILNLICVILLLFWALNMISDVVLIQSPWKSASMSSLLYTNKTSSVGSDTNQDSTRYLKVDARHLQQLCGKLQGTKKQNEHQHGRLMLNRSLYYCGIPKCGSTFMGVFLPKILINSDSNISTKFMFEINRWQNISDAFAFTFVREPYSRLFSAYENKLFHPNEFWRRLGLDIIREVRQKASEVSKRLGHDVTFAELIQYVVKLTQQGRKLNSHLASMHTICNPCRQQFDFIGKLETMTEDLVHLVDEWKTRGIISRETNAIEPVESETKYKRSLGRIHHMFLTYKNSGHHISKYKLFQRTWSSYQIRGMILNAYKMPYDEFTVGRVDIELYTQAVKSAMNNSKGYENELKAQRKEALLQAYRTVPVYLMDKLRSFVKTDCVMFGYDDKPELLFNRSILQKSSGQDYFKWL